MKKLLCTQSPLQAQLVQNLLEQDGIRSVIQGEVLWGARGELPFTSDSAPSVWIADDADETRALEIVRAHDGALNPAVCSQCGYDLRGLGDPRCPECGTPFRRAGTWKCRTCGELLGSQFAQCWSCRTQREEEPELAVSETTARARGEADPRCDRCDGAGRYDRTRAFRLLVMGGALLLLAFTADFFSGVFQQGRLYAPLLDASPFLVLSLTAFTLARFTRNRTCPCTEGEDAVS